MSAENAIQFPEVVSPAEWQKARDALCVGCSMVTDQFGPPEHLRARDISFCMVSLAPLKNIQKYKNRMGWTLPWYSSAGSDFNKDFGRTTDKGEHYGLSVFIRDDK